MNLHFLLSMFWVWLPGPQTGSNHLLEADDLMRFKPAQLRVKAGSQVSIKLTNVGKIKSIQRDFILLSGEADVAKFGNALMTSGSVDSLSPSLKGWVLVQSKAAGPGQTLQVSFKAPPPGVYYFISSTPGQYVNKGRLISE